MPFTNVRANQLPDGIASWKVKAAGDPAYHALPFIKDGEVKITTLFTNDAKGRQYPYAFKLEAKVLTMATNVTNIIKLLDSIGSLNIDHKITTISGLTFSSENLADKYLGTKFKLVSDGDMDKDRYIEISVSRILTQTEYTALISAPPVDGTPSGDVLLLLDSLVRTDIRAAGIIKVESRVKGAGSWTDDHGSVRNGKLTYELMGAVDSRGRFCGNRIEITVEFEMLQASSAELGLFDDKALQENDFRFTLADSAMLTLIDTVGTQWEYSVAGVIGDTSTIKWICKGVVPISGNDGLWS